MTPEAPEGARTTERPVANCDQEALVQHRIMDAMRMAVKMSQCIRVAASGPSYEYGLHGLAEGTAREIIETLGMEPGYVNIRRIERGPYP